MSNLERWLSQHSNNSFRDLVKMEDFFNRSFKDATSGNIPSCELTEDDTSYTLKFDLPGIKKDQVNVEIDGDQLTVKAERHQEKKQESKKKYFSEISYGSYMRTMTLPSAIDEKKVDAKFENGVLTVTVPKETQAETKIKQIKVQ